MRNQNNCLSQLQAAGFVIEDACALRRISMTLHRWHELECGDGNDHASWCITRGDWEKAPASRAPRQPDGSRWLKVFKHDEAGKPFLEWHGHNSREPDYRPLADRERGALKRLAAIMARYPRFASYVQSDPRGCSLYILHPDQLIHSSELRDTSSFREWLSANYSRGIAVCK